jgi:multifunctional methyltransferase subunit TRM112
MRLLAHNLLMCNVKKCDKNNYPLLITVEKSMIIESDFKKEAILKMIPKLDWTALARTVHSVHLSIYPLARQP